MTDSTTTDSTTTDGDVTEGAAADSEVTAPRRPRRLTWAVAGAALLACLFLVGAALVSATGNDSAGAPADDSADVGFARDMTVHHQQAVEMSFVVRDRTDDEDVRRLAYDIANTQANQRGMMLGWLDMWGLSKTSADPPMAWMDAGHSGHRAQGGALMPGMATSAQLERLRKAEGEEAEVLYLRLMTEHHRGGVAMARGCAQQCEVPQERSLAQGMADAQASEMKLMADMLRERGAAPKA